MRQLPTKGLGRGESPRQLTTGADVAAGDAQGEDIRAAELRRARPRDVPARCFVRCVIESSAAEELSKLRTRARLTHAEVEVLGCALLRMTYREIATARRVSLNTVKSQMKALLAKLGIDRAADLAEALARLSEESVDREFTLRLEAEGVRQPSFVRRLGYEPR